MFFWTLKSEKESRSKAEVQELLANAYRQDQDIILFEPPTLHIQGDSSHWTVCTGHVAQVQASTQVQAYLLFFCVKAHRVSTEFRQLCSPKALCAQELNRQDHISLVVSNHRLCCITCESALKRARKCTLPCSSVICPVQLLVQLWHIPCCFSRLCFSTVYKHNPKVIWPVFLSLNS